MKFRPRLGPVGVLPVETIPVDGGVEPVLPDWVPPAIDDTSRLPASQIRAERAYTFLSADDAILPEAFGKCVIPPRFASIVRSGADIVLRCIWCRGEQGSMTLYAGNELFTGAVTHYTGTATQVANAQLVALIPGYTDTLDGICYSVITIPGDQLDLANSLLIVVDGRTITDPRTVPTNLSDNPALCYYYVATAIGLTVDIQSIKDAADFCDEVVGSEKRWVWGMVFDQPVEIERQLKLIAEYASCYHVRDGGTVKLVPDRQTSTTFRFSDTQADVDSIVTGIWTADANHFTVDSFYHTADGSQVAVGMIAENSLKLSKKRLTSLPNQSIVQYTNVAKFPWRKPYAKSVVPSGDIRPTTFNMFGYRSYNTALRYATERQNKFDLTDLSVSFESFDEGLSVETGDVVDVTHNVGLTREKIRVINTPSAKEPGHWLIRGESYDPAVYSDVTGTEPVYNDITLPDPSAVPDGPTPTVTDKNYTDEMGNTYSILSIAFTGVSWPWASDYRVKVYFGSFVVLETTVAARGAVTHTVPTAAVTQGALYTIEVWVLNKQGGISTTPGTATKMADGKALGPSDVPDTVTGVENGYFISLEWEAATDSDLQGYLVKRLGKVDYEAAANDNARWGHTNVVVISDRNDLTAMQVPNQPVGDYYYGIKALDKVYPKAGHESVTASWILVTVTANAGAGVNARAVNLIIANQVIEYDTSSANPNPATAVVTATALNTSGTVYYEFFLNDVSVQNTTVATYTYTAPVSYTSMPEKLVVYIREGANTGTILARDQITVSGLRAGTDALTIVVSNEAHTLPASSAGVVSSYAGSGTNIRLFEGVTALEYDGVGTADGTWKVTAAGNNIAPSPLPWSDLGTYVSTGAHSTMNDASDTATIIYTISGVRLDGTAISAITKKQTFAKSLAGVDGAAGSDGAAGVDARGVNLTIADQTIAYNTNGASPSPASATLAATAVNTTGTVYYEFFLNDVSVQNTAVSTYPYVSPSAYSSMPEKLEVQIREGASTGPILARDQLTVSGLKAGTDAIAVIVDNEAHTLPTTNTGVVTYSGSGTDIDVWEGTSKVPYGSATPGFLVSTANTNISVGAASTVTTYTRRFADHSSMTADDASIDYTVTVKNSAGVTSVFTKKQTFAKSLEGADGATGAAGSDGAAGAAGVDGMTFVLSNSAHTIPTDSAGNSGDYTGSGTEVRVYEGATELVYDGVGTSASRWDIGTIVDTNITVGSTTDSGNYVTIGVASVMTADTASIGFPISGKRADGSAFSITLTQTFSKAKSGSTGGGGGNPVQLTGATVTHNSTTPTDARAEWGLYADGKEKKKTGTSSFIIIADWLISGALADYQVKVTLNSGTSPSGSAVGSWLSLSTFRYWYLTDTSPIGPNITCSLTAEIRNAITLTVIDTASVTLNAQESA